MLAFISFKQENKKKANQFIEKLQNLDLKRVTNVTFGNLMGSLYNIEDDSFKLEF